MAVFNKFYIFARDLAEKKHNLYSDSLKVFLTNVAVDSTINFQTKSDVTEIATGNGYSGPIAVNNTGARYDGQYIVTGIKITITATGNIPEFRYVVLYNDTQTSPADPLIGYWDYGSAVNLTNGDTFEIKFNDSDGTGNLLLIE